MTSITRSPNPTNVNMNNAYFSNYINSSPHLYSEASLQEYHLHNNSQCNCSCHCHQKNSRKFHQNSSYNNLTYKNNRDLNIISISDNNVTNEKKSLTKNKSLHNMKPYPNDKLYLFQELKKNYTTNYNYNTENKYTNFNNTSYKNSYYSPSNNRKIKNHSFVDIKEINNNTRKEDETKYYKVQLKRKQLSKFYHNIGLKKYHYGYGKIQTTDKTNNHKYTEIYGTSGSNNENTNNKRNNIRINYEFTNNKNNTNYNNINGNEKYNNPIFSFSNDFTKSKNTQINSAGKNDSEVESKILKETYNTRLIEVKSPSKEKNSRYKSNYYLNDTRKNLFNSYQRRTEYNGQNNNKNSKYNEYKFNNNNAYTNKPKLNISDTDEISNNNCKHRFTKYNHVPYALSLGNKVNEQNNIDCNNMNMDNENILKKKMNLLRNNRINNINYKILKQKVRLSLLKKQIYEQKRNMLFNNNKGYYNPNLIINDNLCEKTRQLMNKDNYPDVVNNYNYGENFE
jgi:hypothetical protein